jgi:hypothetical protein
MALGHVAQCEAQPYSCGKCGPSPHYCHLRKNGLQRDCITCAKARARLRRETKGEEINEWHKQYQRRSRDKKSVKLKQIRRNLKTLVIAAYGGRCECCWETGWEFLSIDHKSGGGNKHREALGGSYSFYRWLRDSGFPKDEYQLLCMNCNFAIGKYGRCPHEVAREKLA